MTEHRPSKPNRAQKVRNIEYIMQMTEPFRSVEIGPILFYTLKEKRLATNAQTSRELINYVTSQTSTHNNFIHGQ